MGIQDQGVRQFLARAAAGIDAAAAAMSPLAAAALLQLAASRLRAAAPAPPWPAPEPMPPLPALLSQGQLAGCAHMCRMLAGWLRAPVADVTDAPADEREAGAQVLEEAARLIERGAGVFGPDGPRLRLEQAVGAMRELAAALGASHGVNRAPAP